HRRWASRLGHPGAHSPCGPDGGPPAQGPESRSGTRPNPPGAGCLTTPSAHATWHREVRAGRPLAVSPLMRTQATLLLLSSLLAGCFPFRSKPTAPPPPAPEPRIVQKPVAPPAPRHLACIQHPRIDLWEYRLRRNADFRLATTQSVDRAQEYLP